MDVSEATAAAMNIFITLPTGSSVAYKEEHIETTIDEQSYLIWVKGSAMFGLCPEQNERTSKVECKYDDEKAKFMATLRFWKEGNKVVSINPQGILVDGYSKNYIIIQKKDSSTFSAKEITLWKNILGTFGLEPTPEFTFN